MRVCMYACMHECMHAYMRVYVFGLALARIVGASSREWSFISCQVIGKQFAGEGQVISG